mgnify:CR=1 FL=1
MEVFEFDLTGSYLILIISIIAAVLVTIFTYRNTIPPISSSKKNTLIFLRSTALAILIFILFEPFINIIRGIDKKPSIAVFVDNSLSMSFETENYDKKEKLNSILQSYSTENEIIPYMFDNDIVKTSTLDSLELNGNSTNLSKNFDLLERITFDENIKAAIIISDGNFNEGDNPIYKAERSGLPVYTIGIGDTTGNQDLIVNSIITNKVAYVDNAIPVNVNLEVVQFEDLELKVELFEDGVLLETQTFNKIEGKDNYQVLFEYVPNQAGNKKLEARIEKADGEITYKNNFSFEYVKVLENKKLISVFGGSPSSDISFLSKYFNTKKGVELKKYIQKVGPKFYKVPSQKDISETELFVLIGFPNVYTPKNILESIAKELEKGKSLLFINSYDVDYNNLEYLKQYLPFNVISKGKKEFDAAIYADPSDLTDPIIKYTGSENDIDLWNQLPPIYKTETFVKASSGSKVVFDLKMNNSVLEEPMLIRRDIGGKKVIAFMGYGLYKWKLGYASDISKNKLDSPDMYNVFFDNVFKWLSVKENRKRFTISSLKKNYNSGEKVEFLAELYDDKFDAFDDASVELKILSENDELLREIILNSIGNGRYIASVEGLNSGDIKFYGEAYFNDDLIAKDNGRFNIGETPKEFLKTGLNEKLLSDLSNRTNGKYSYEAKLSDVINDIRNNEKFKSKTVFENERIDIWQHPLLLIIAVILFSIEWFIRKRSGML